MASEAWPKRRKTWDVNGGNDVYREAGRVLVIYSIQDNVVSMEMVISVNKAVMLLHTCKDIITTCSSDSHSIFFHDDITMSVDEDDDCGL